MFRNKKECLHKHTNTSKYYGRNKHLKCTHTYIVHLIYPNTYIQTHNCECALYESIRLYIYDLQYIGCTMYNILNTDSLYAFILSRTTTYIYYNI